MQQKRACAASKHGDLGFETDPIRMHFEESPISISPEIVLAQIPGDGAGMKRRPLHQTSINAIVRRAYEKFARSTDVKAAVERCLGKKHGRLMKNLAK